MQCQECGHNVPDGERTCMYCGAALQDVVSTGSRDKPEPDALKKRVTHSTENANRTRVSYEISEERKIYDSLDDIPEPLREKVKQALKHGGGDVQVEFETPTQESFTIYSLPQTKARSRMNRFMLAIIFLVSIAVGAFFVWLLS